MRRTLTIYCTMLLAAAALQGTLVSYLVVAGARPDLFLVVIVVGGLLARTEGGMALGFAGGVLQGSLVGMSHPSFIISRLVPGWFAGLMETRIFRENLLVPPLAAAVGTLVGEIVFLLFNPPEKILAQFQIIGIEAGLNAILAPFVYLILAHFLKEEK